jgi:hypothetical protein
LRLEEWKKAIEYKKALNSGKEQIAIAFQKVRIVMYRVENGSKRKLLF